MHRITTSARYEFRVEATDYDNVTESIEYPHFVILPETDDYAVNIGHGVGDLREFGLIHYRNYEQYRAWVCTLLNYVVCQT